MDRLILQGLRVLLKLLAQSKALILQWYTMQEILTQILKLIAYCILCAATIFCLSSAVAFVLWVLLTYPCPR